MKACEIGERLELECVTGSAGLENEIKSGYIGDLLSWVMSNAEADCVWVTIQGHINIVAVASLIGIGCIILSEGSIPDEDTVKKAIEENIPIFLSKMAGFQVVKELSLNVGI